MNILHSTSRSVHSALPVQLTRTGPLATFIPNTGSNLGLILGEPDPAEQQKQVSTLAIHQMFSK